jgi:hypothetical protein
MTNLQRLIGLSPAKHTISTSTDKNAHVLITGISGSGKTYLNFNLILQDYLNKIPVVIIDVANSFKVSEMPDEFKKIVGNSITIYTAGRDIIPINPLICKDYIDDGELYTETPNQVASRVASLLKTPCSLGSQQYPAVLRAIIDIYSKASDKLPSFESLLNYLYIANKYAAQAANKIYPITASVQFSDTDANIWNELLSPYKITIFQLSSLGNESIKLVSDIILDDLSKHLQLCGDKLHPTTLVLDELQKLNTSTDSVLGKMLVEARKYGLSAICSTQFLKFNNTTILRQLEQANTKIYFKPAERDFNELEKFLSANSNLNWHEVIRLLEKRRCIVETGQALESELDKLVYVYSIPALLEAINYVPAITVADS